MSDSDSPKPDCYGNPEKVCPIGEKGVIDPNLECLRCTFIKSCLTSALQKRGILATPVKEKPIIKKTVDFLNRWSRLKRKSAGRGGE